ncbi:MAG: transglycosylase SLT domain-containing protein [Myxococcota bacterium]
MNRRAALTTAAIALVFLGPALYKSATALASPADPAAQQPLPDANGASGLGSWLLNEPTVPPGGAPTSATPSLSRVRAHLTAGDLDRALSDAQRIVAEAKWGRERTLASFVSGLIYRERGLHNLASENFTRVRSTGGPLAEWGGFYEAEQDRMRGKPWTAVRECERLRARFKDSRFDAACQRLMARALVEAGATSKARKVADTHDEAFEDNAIREQIDLAIAHRWVDSHPEWARPLLQELAVEFKAPLTGRISVDLLNQMRAAGHADAVVPDDALSLQKRAMSLRDSKQRAQAAVAFAELKARAEGDPALQRWVDGNANRFAWRTHDWPALIALSEAAVEAGGDEKEDWQLFKAYDRGGRHADALAVALKGLKDHGRTRRWKRSEEVLARTALMARDYTQARALFDTVAERGGWAGRRSAYTAGFAAFMANDHEDAVRRFSAVIASNKGFEANSRYWRSKSYDALGKTEEAEADRQWLLTQAPIDWYAVLLRRDGATKSGPPWDRNGRWVAPPPPPLPAVEAHPLVSDSLPVARPTRTRRNALDASPLTALTWPLRASHPLVASPVRTPPSDAFLDPLRPPESYKISDLWDADDAKQRLDRAARNYGKAWPEFVVARDLADAGLWDLSGPVMSEIFEEWKEARRNARHEKHALARRISYKHKDWRPLFYATRDHHHTDRFTHGLWDQAADPEMRQEAIRLGWPLAHDHAVWTHARTHNVDPYLVLSIMRIESRYNAIAVSPVGARGAMQIMPRTGRLLANLRTDEEFMTGDLEDPVFAVEYGIFYMGQLLDRFDGAYPLAVASYNGGPFSVSRWLNATGDLPMDAFVEHIPYRETRRYVRKVVAAYDTYLTAYEPAGTGLHLPQPPYADRPELADFQCNDVCGSVPRRSR